jgi:hypothetical protein
MGWLPSGFSAVILDSVGATPLGIYLLAESFSKAASGPVRLPSDGGCELLLEAFLRADIG